MLVKTICLSLLTVVYNSPFIIRFSDRLATVLFFVTIVLDEVRPKVMCIHTKMIIVCRRLQAVKKKRERLLVVYVCHVCCGSKDRKNVLFRSIMVSLEKSVSTVQFPVNRVIKFGPC